MGLPRLMSNILIHNNNAYILIYIVYNIHTCIHILMICIYDFLFLFYFLLFVFYRGRKTEGPEASFTKLIFHTNFQPSQRNPSSSICDTNTNQSVQTDFGLDLSQPLSPIQLIIKPSLQLPSVN